MTQHVLQNPTLMGTSDAAAALGVDKATITRWAASGRLTPVVRIGDGHRAPMGFDPADVERLRRIRAGETGDVIDRVDVDAAGLDPAESRKAAIRAAWLDAIDLFILSGHPDYEPGTFSTGKARPYVDREYRHGGPQVGALIAGLVRSKRIEWTGKRDDLADPYNRHATTACKVYRVIGDLS